MGTKNNPGQFDCFGKAEADEPTFTLRAKDPAAPETIRAWGRERRKWERCRRKPDEAARLEEAEACASAMERWRNLRR